MTAAKAAPVRTAAPRTETEPTRAQLQADLESERARLRTSDEAAARWRRAAEERDKQNDELRTHIHVLELDLAHLRGRMAQIDEQKPPLMAPAPPVPSQYSGTGRRLAYDLERGYGASRQRPWFLSGP